MVGAAARTGAGAPDTPYADWLIAVFDHWYPSPGTPIRLFEEIMQLLLGATPSERELGLSPARIVVIETDGAIELADKLKVAYHGAGMTGLHVASNPLDDALLLPGVVARQLGSRALSPQCRGCPIRRVCGGGLYAHRYREGSGFYNPSVYCPDLMKLIGHIRETMRADSTSDGEAGHCMTERYHAIPRDLFDALAAGGGGPGGDRCAGRSGAQQAPHLAPRRPGGRAAGRRRPGSPRPAVAGRCWTKSIAAIGRRRPGWWAIPLWGPGPSAP